MDEIVEPVESPTSLRNTLHVVDATSQATPLARNVPEAVLLLPDERRVHTDEDAPLTSGQ